MIPPSRLFGMAESTYDARVTSAGPTLEEIIAAHIGREGPLLPILHDVQDAFGFISEADIIQIAKTLNLSRAEVSGVVGFYHDFRRTLEPRPVIKLCRAEACQSRGGEDLARWAEANAGPAVKIETVYCLGLCSVGPSAMTGDEVHARLDRQSLGDLIERMAAS